MIAKYVEDISTLGITQEISSNQNGAARKDKNIAAKLYRGKIEFFIRKIFGIEMTDNQ